MFLSFWDDGVAACRCEVSMVHVVKARLVFLVFRAVRRRPQQVQGVERRRGQHARLWGNPASGHGHSPPHFLWWTDGPCSAWLQRKTAGEGGDSRVDPCKEKTPQSRACENCTSFTEGQKKTLYFTHTHAHACACAHTMQKEMSKGAITQWRHLIFLQHTFFFY